MRDGKIEQIGTPEEILSTPANEYIENFVKDIDKTKVIQAKNIMFKPALISLKDGLNVAAKEMEKNGISSIFVVDSDRRLLGLVTIDDTIKAIKEQKTLKEILKHDYNTTGPETYIQDLLPIATESKYPIAVIDEKGKFLGIIVRVSVLSALI